MKVLTVNHSDSLGGAARAAYRIHRALRRSDIDSQMIVNHSTTGDPTVTAPSSAMHKLMARVGPHVDAQLCRLQTVENPVHQSPACIPSSWLRRINASDADVVHLHWIGAETLSIEDVGKITKPVVWTLHDMWAFSGTEHYPANDRWKAGYHGHNRPAGERGWDMNRWAWRRKQKAWKRPMTIAPVSSWLASCASESALMGAWPITPIPNTLDTDVWKPVDKRQARALLGIPEGAPVVAFGAWGVSQPHKGRDLLQVALHALRSRDVDLRPIIFGQMEPERPEDTGYTTRYLGHLSDDLSLRVVYSAADVMVVPSRVEAFGQTASEAMACATAVVAFDATGLRDVVEHRKTGYLARPFDAADLAEGIHWVLTDPARVAQLGEQGRSSAVARFSHSVIAARYREIYSEALVSHAPMRASASA